MDSSGQACVATSAIVVGNSPKLTKNGAIQYLKNVKDTFRDERDKYNEFLKIILDLESQRMDGTAGFLRRVKELLKGHHELILEFNTFLPKGSEIKVIEEKKPHKFGEAISLLKKIKNRFQSNDCVYKSFLCILRMYKQEKKSIHEVHQEVAALFQNHHDLLEKFTQFLPDASTTMSQQHVSSGGVRREAKCSRIPIVTQTYVEKTKRAYKPHTSGDLGIDLPNMEHDRRILCAEKEKDRKEERDRRERELDEKDEHDSRDSEHVPKKRRKPSPIIDDSVAEQTFQSGGGVENFGTYNTSASSIDEKNNLKKSVQNERDMTRPVEAGDNDSEREHERNERDRNSQMERDKVRVHLNKGRAFVSEVAVDDKVDLVSNEEKKNQCIPTSDLEFSNSQRCTPSYCLLPKDYRMPAASHMTKLGKSVLNNDVVSRPCSSEDYTSNCRPENLYEQSLFSAEDDRFELDMLLESVKATIRGVENLIKKMQDNPKKPKTPIRIEDHLSISNLRIIERLYDNYGPDAIEIIRKNPSRALLVILTRLKQLQEEWLQCHVEADKIWREAYVENYHKSLDPPSSDVKQLDKELGFVSINGRSD